MKTIGIRAEKDKIHWAVIEGTSARPILVADGKFSAPRSYEEHDQLAWYYQRVQTLIQEYTAKYVAVRYAETFLQHKPKPNVLASMYSRARIEGVAIAASAANGVRVFTGSLTTIAASLGSQRAKRYLEDGEVRGIDLTSKPANRREAILTGVAVLGKSLEMDDEN